MRTIHELGGTTKLLLESPHPDEEPYGYLNPSIAYSPKTGYQVLIRSANYRVGRDDYETRVYGSHYILNRNYLADLSDENELVNLRLISEEHGKPDLHRGIEDGRIVWNTENSTWRIICTLYEPPVYPEATVAEYELDPKTMQATFLKSHASPVGTAEKNWMAPIEPGGFDYVYDAFRTITDGEIQQHLPETDEHRYLHGGSQLLPQKDGTHLALVHMVTSEPTETDYYTRMSKRYLAGTSRRVYHHYFAEYSAEGKMLRLSEPFVFDRLGIEFAAGMVEQDGDLLISYGENDETCRLASLPKSAALDALRPLV